MEFDFTLFALIFDKYGIAMGLVIGASTILRYLVEGIKSAGLLNWAPGKWKLAPILIVAFAVSKLLLPWGQAAIVAPIITLASAGIQNAKDPNPKP